MRCQHCTGKTRVVATEHREDGTHRWLRCHQCDALTRTIDEEAELVAFDRDALATATAAASEGLVQWVGCGRKS